MKLKLFVDIFSNSLVTSGSSNLAKEMPKVFREDDIDLEVQFVEPTGSMTTPVSIVSTANMTIKVGIGEIDQTIEVYQGTFTNDTTNNLFTGNLNLNTTELVASFNALATGTESMERFFEIEITETSRRTTVFQEKITLHKDIITNSLLTPSQVQAPSAFQTTLLTVLQDSETIEWTSSTNNVEAHIKGLSAQSLTNQSGKIVQVKTSEDGFELNPASSVGASAIDDLSDVDTSTNAPAAGNHLRWDGTNWIPDASAIAHTHDIDSLTDVDVSTNAPATGDHLYWDGTNWIPDAVSASSHTHAIDNLSDVDTSTNVPADGNLLNWDSSSSNWIPTSASVVSDIDDLTDVDTSTNAPTTGDQLQWTGTQWMPAAGWSTGLNAFGKIDVAGKVSVIADGSQDAVEFIEGSGITISTDAVNDKITFESTASTTLVGLAETPSNLGTANQILKMNSGATAVEWAADEGATAIVGLSDTPSSLGTANQILKMNSGATALEWAADASGSGSGSTTIVGLTDTPSSLGSADQILKMNSGATALEWATDETGSGATTIIGLTDTPSSLGSADQILKMNSGGTALEWAADETGSGGGTNDVELGFAVSNETGDLIVMDNALTFRMPHDMTLTEVRANVNTAPSGGSPIILDINQNGSTILSSKLEIDSTQKTSTTATNAAVISTSSLTDDSEITIDITQIGPTNSGEGLKLWLIGTR